MKTRNGFVSNSSSSSFIIRGVLVSKEECIKLFGTADKYEIEMCDGLTVRSEVSGEWGDDDSGLIFGKSWGGLNEGAATEIKEPDEKIDEEIRTKLKAVGIEGEIKTYASFLGRDG